MDDTARKYRLFALPFAIESAKAATGQRFSRISSGYVLIYTDGEAPHNSAEITEEEVGRLTKQDARWLYDCNVALLAEETKAHEKEILASVKEQLDKLEEALAAQMEGKVSDA